MLPLSGLGGGPFAYRVIEIPDKSSCKVCKFMHGKTLPYKLFKRGITAPPFHTSCKGFVEVIDRKGTVLFIRGQQPDAMTDLIDKVADAFDPERALDVIQFIVDLIGLVPVTGEIADGVNAFISLARGNMLDAGLSALSAIPFVGWTSAGGKWIKNLLKHGDEIADIAKYSDEAIEIIDGVAKYGDEIVEGVEKGLKESAEEAVEDIGKHIDDVADGARDSVKTNLGREVDIKPSASHSTTTQNPGLTGKPNSSVDILDSNGNIKTRRWYGPDGYQIRDVDFTNYGNPKVHSEWPHEHGPRE